MTKIRFGINDFSINDLSILYIDNIEYKRDDLKNVLSSLTKELYLANDGSKGLKIFEEKKPDIIITDLYLPVMNGLEMIKKIRAISSTVPILAKVGKGDEKILIESVGQHITYIERDTDVENFIKTIVQIAEYLLVQKELDEKDNFILALIDINPSNIAIIGENKVYYLNQSFMRFLGINSMEEFNEKFNGLSSLVVDQDYITEEEQFKDWESSNIGRPVRVKMPGSDEIHTFLITTVSMPPNHTNFLITFTNVTHIENEKSYYQYLAEYDQLTKIYNRTRLYKELETEISRAVRYQTKLCALMIDIDHFKKVNDTYGHPVGDLILIEFAQQISKAVRKTDVYGRYGGEEFLVLLPATNIPNAKRIAERVRKNVENKVFHNNIRITCSIGISEYILNEPFADFIKRSDDALYMAKNSGRNRVEIL